MLGLRSKKGRLQLAERGYPRTNNSRFRRLASRQIFVGALLAQQLGLAVAAESASVAERGIRSAIESWRNAFNERDEQQVCGLFAPDLVANYQGEPARDYDSLCEMLRSALRDRGMTYRYSVRINDVIVDGDSAVVRLVWALEVEKAGGPTRTTEESAIDIFRRQSDGSWKISRYLAYPEAR
jgi:uncharacterized protein (TIGR02246 family)